MTVEIKYIFGNKSKEKLSSIYQKKCLDLSKYVLYLLSWKCEMAVEIKSYIHKYCKII